MANKMLTITLLEDLHLGTGLGLGDIDSTQQRDRNNNPVIPATHIKGVLKQAAHELNQLAEEILPLTLVNELFGKGAKQQGKLKLTSAYLSSNSCQTLIWGSTRIGENGIADEGSLRQVEYVPAGQSFTLEISLPQKLFPSLELIINRCTHLGAGRNRGQGLVSWQIEGKSDARKHKLKSTKHYPSKLRLLIKNLEPLCFAQTAHPGNLIATESYIPSKALCGALVAGCLATGNRNLAQQLLLPQISWGAAYPLPNLHNALNERELSGLTVMPIPLSIGSLKTPKGLKGSTYHPWWAFKPKFVHLGERGGLDQLMLEEEQDKKQEKLKRPAANEYLYQEKTGNKWQRYKPEIMERLRNQVPSKENKFSQALFSNAEIAENTHFVADILLNSAEQAQALVQALNNQGENWLYLGRGGRPAIIEQAIWLNIENNPTEFKNNFFTLLLESDLIARDNYGNFYDRLNEVVLVELADLPAEISKKIKIEKNYSEGKTLYGFNANTGLPSQAVQAIKAGSAIKVTGEAASEVYQALASKLCLGEFTHQGFGRFGLNNQPKPAVAIEPQIDLAQKIDKKTQHQENLCAEAKKLAENLQDELKKGPSPSQWGDFRNLTQAANNQAELNQVFTQFEQAGTKQGGQAWANFFATQSVKTLKNYADFERQKDENIKKLIKNLSDAQTFLEFFFRWQRALTKNQNKDN